MRFYSHWIHVIWLYRLVDIYYPFASRSWNTATLILYGIVGGCDYANRRIRLLASLLDRYAYCGV